MSQAGKKLINATKEAAAIARGDIEAIEGCRVTPSCGCVFCDVGLEPHEDGMHRANGHETRCRRERALR